MFKKVLATSALLALATSAAHAQTTVYDTINGFTTYAGNYFSGGGATAASPYTYLAADDINVLSGYAGGKVTSFSWTEANVNSGGTTDSISPIVSFYAANGTGITGLAGPGTLLASYTFAPSILPEGQVSSFTYTPVGSAFTIPTSGLFYAGVTFTSATATAAQLNNIGQGLFASNAVGTSSKYFFFGSSSSNTATGSSPAGGIYSFTGSTAYQYGWTFTATAAPEPSQYAAFALGILGVGALALKARRRNVAA